MSYSAKKIINKSEKGFTLIEVLVSLSIFIMVITVAVGVLLTMVDANARAQNMQLVMTNLAFSIDSMSREIRTGTHYFCRSGGGSNLPHQKDVRRVQDCDEGESERYAFAFREGGNSLTSDCAGKWIGYRYNATDKSIERRLCDGDWFPITSDDVDIETLTFTVTGTDPTDAWSPLVNIYVAGRVVGTQKTESAFAMQTSVSQHLLDL